MTFVQILGLQLTAFFATALVVVWFMTRPTSAAKRVLGMARLLPAQAERRRVVPNKVQGQLLRGVHFVGARLGITTGEKLRKRFVAAGLRSESSIDIYVAVRLLSPIAVLVFWSFFRDVTFFWITV